jgi:uncharacterized membrane protein
MSEDSNSRDLEERVAKLEHLMEQMRRSAPHASQEPQPPALGRRPVRDPFEAPPFAEQAPQNFEPEDFELGEFSTEDLDFEPTLARDGERWLARVGVLFLFLGLAFLFNYALSRGFLTPSLRVGLGLVLASTLLGLGFKLNATRQLLSQILLGGSIALYFLIGFAAHQLYQLVPQPVAFVYMALVAVLALFLSARRSLPSLACIGASGGLATPFLVNSSEFNVPALVLYTSAILLTYSAVLWRNGWRSLLFTLTSGGFLVLAMAIGLADPSERLILLLGILSWWQIGGLLPMHFNLGASGEPGAQAPAPFPAVMLRLGTIAATLCALGLVLTTWDIETKAAAWPILLVPAVLYALHAFQLRKRALIPSISSETSAIFLALAIAFMGSWEWCFLALLVQVAALFELGRRPRLKTLSVLAHGLLILLCGAYLLDACILLTSQQAEGFSLVMGPHLALLPALMILPRSFRLSASFTSFYSAMAHILLLLTSFAELSQREHGLALVSAAWGVQGTLVLLLGLKLKLQKVQMLGLGTLGLVSAKMLLYDMAMLDMIWRILLFFGVGAVFLGLSYVINRHGKPQAQQNAPGPSANPSIRPGDSR